MDQTTSYKRPRSLSVSSSASSSSSTPPSPTPKAFRSSSPSSSSQYTCSLPPSCQDTPTSFSSLDSLEAHNRTYHAFVCTAPQSSFEWAVGKGKGKEKEREEGACGRVFPDERVLSLHLTECHDEMAQLRRERGEKIFACLDSSCSQLFSTPKTRRLHLISKHCYPSQYFFGVTIWGVEDVLKKGGGMVRRDWQPRAGQPGYRSGSSDGQASVSPPPPPQPQLHRSPSPPPASAPCDLDDLALALAGTSISLVPRAVRMARKKKVST